MTNKKKIISFVALLTLIVLAPLGNITTHAAGEHNIDDLTSYGLPGSGATIAADSSNIKVGDTYTIVKTTSGWSTTNVNKASSDINGSFYEIRNSSGTVVGHAFCGAGSKEGEDSLTFKLDGTDSKVHKVEDATINKLLANSWGGCHDLMGQSYLSRKNGNNNANNEQAYLLTHAYLHNSNTAPLTKSFDKKLVEVATSVLNSAPNIPDGCTGSGYYVTTDASHQPMYFWVEESAAPEVNINRTMTYDPATEAVATDNSRLQSDASKFNTSPDLTGYSLYNSTVISARFTSNINIESTNNNLAKAEADKTGAKVTTRVNSVRNGSRNFGNYFGLSTNAYKYGSALLPYMSAGNGSKTSYKPTSPAEGLQQAFDNTTDGGTSSGKQVSIGSEIYIKNYPINYYVYEIKIEKNKDKMSTSSIYVDTGTYNITDNETFVTGYGQVMLCVENLAGDKANTDVVAQMENVYQTPTTQVFNVAKALYGDNAFEPCTVNIGYNKHDTEFRGYTIIIVSFEDISEYESEGQLTLHQEELNHWYSDMVADSSAELGQTNVWRLQKTDEIWSWVFTNTISHETTENPSQTVPHNNYDTKDYHINVVDSTQGSEQGDDSTSWYYKAAGTGTVDNNRSVIAKGVNYDFLQYGGALTTYRFNQVRAFSGDKRTISSITGTGANNNQYLEYATNQLKCGHNNVWSGSTPSDYIETLHMKATSGVTDSRTRYNYHQLHSDSYGCQWYTLMPANSFSPFTYNGENSITFTHTVTCKTLKYTTKDRGLGYAELNDGTKIVDTILEATNNRKVTNFATSHFGKFAMTKDNGISVKYYTEVPMTEEMLADGTVNKALTMTISEKIRNTELSSMYLMSINETDKPIEGVTYSESAMTGINNSGDYVYLTNGSGFTYKADTNMTLDFYGYSLDLISKTDDEEMTMPVYASNGKYTGERIIKYTDIIHDNSNVRTDWQNSESDTEKLETDFKNWVAELTDSELYGIDMELKLENTNSDKAYTGFSGSFGSLTSNYPLNKDYTFPITVVHGQIVKDQTYTNLIYQIANDYKCNYDEAEALFVNSGIVKSITSAIESSSDGDNTSDKSRNGGVGTWYYNNYDYVDISYDENHWYDEDVKTFVIRRYTKIGYTFNDYVLNDKIDIATHDFNTSVLNNNGSVGKWYMNIYFKKAFTGASFIDSDTYSPNALTNRSMGLYGTKNLKDAASLGAVLVYNAYSQDKSGTMKSDFKVQSSTTVEDFDY